MPFASIPAAQPTTRRDKRLIIGAVAAVVLVLVAVGIWSLVRPGSYGASRNGCITVNLPSSTGGSLIHQCGSNARATCAQAFTNDARVSQFIRPQCRLAGLGPAAPAPKSS
jgi:type II secretory pathway component PulM